MSWNNILPHWLLDDTCPKCGKKLKYSREEKPGVDCVNCGGDLELADKELEDDTIRKTSTKV